MAHHDCSPERQKAQLQSILTTSHSGNEVPSNQCPTQQQQILKHLKLPLTELTSPLHHSRKRKKKPSRLSLKFNPFVFLLIFRFNLGLTFQSLKTCPEAVSCSFLSDCAKVKAEEEDLQPLALLQNESVPLKTKVSYFTFSAVIKKKNEKKSKEKAWMTYMRPRPVRLCMSDNSLHL